jgi:hypothetical protein
MISLHHLVTSTINNDYYWIGGAALENHAYPGEVEVPDFTWRWFSTGGEIPKDYYRWMQGEPTQEFDQEYQTYVGCVAMTAHDKMKTFNCRTPLRYVCEIMWET